MKALRSNDNERIHKRRHTGNPRHTWPVYGFCVGGGVMNLPLWAQYAATSFLFLIVFGYILSLTARDSIEEKIFGLIVLSSAAFLFTSLLIGIWS